MRAGIRTAAAPSHFPPAEWATVGLMALALLALAVLPGSLLTQLKIHYVMAGGPFIEKLHPATYLVFTAFFVLLLRSADPVRDFDRIVSATKLLLVFLFCWGLLTVQCVVLHRPFSGTIDTFLLPVALSVVLWNLTPGQRRPLVFLLHWLIWLNIAIGYFEFFSGHRLIPLTVGGLPVYGEWRSTALLGTPLAASSVVALYVLALTLRPALCPSLLLRMLLIVFATGSLMAFGGRTALVSVMICFACVAAIKGVRLICGARVELPAVMLAICGLFLLLAAILLLYQHGTFDNMLLRFSLDKGSAHARLSSFRLLSLLDWKEFLFGTDPVRGGSLQSIMGLQYGIESFWIACVVQYGAICTAIIAIGMGSFIVELLRRADPAARVAVLYLVVDASSSVSFSSKNITLAFLIALTVLLLPRARSRAAETAAPIRRPLPARLQAVATR